VPCTLSSPAHRDNPSTYSVSPRDTSPSSPPSPLSSSKIKQEAQSSTADLASQCDSLEPQKDEISSSYFSSTSNSIDPLAEDTFLTVDPEYQNIEPGSPFPLSTLRICRHLQRQLNSQLLCTHSQVKAISDLVEEMVEDMISTKSQCNVNPPSTTSALSAPPESPAGPPHTSPAYIDMPPGLEADDNLQPDDTMDEGFFEGDDEDVDEIDTDALMASLRRAAAPAGIRRLCGYGKGAVYAPPRMRRKILRRKRREQPENGIET